VAFYAFAGVGLKLERVEKEGQQCRSRECRIHVAARRMVDFTE
jgi:hypothetical protein